MKKQSRTHLTTRNSTQTLVLGAVLTALVVVLQGLAEITSLFLPVTIALVLIPIVIGASIGGVGMSAWLGFVFGAMVLAMPSTYPFYAGSAIGTVVTVIAKGVVAGLAAGLVYKLFEKKNRMLAIFLAAIASPVANTGVFLLGYFVFFFNGIPEEYKNVLSFVIIELIGINFVVEFVSNII